MVDQAAALHGTAVGQGLLQGIQHEARMARAAHPPAHDAPRVGVDDEGDADEILPRGDVTEILSANSGGLRRCCKAGHARVITHLG